MCTDYKYLTSFFLKVHLSLLSFIQKVNPIYFNEVYKLQRDKFELLDIYNHIFLHELIFHLRIINSHQLTMIYQ